MAIGGCQPAISRKKELRKWFPASPDEDWIVGGLVRDQALTQAIEERAVECAFERKLPQQEFLRLLDDMWQWPSSIAGTTVAEEEPLPDRFHRLADEWSKEVRTISSVKDLTSHPHYQEIISLGWDVVPFLLIDLTQKRRFWFPALDAITGVRPFDPSDAGNSKRMTEAWIAWGKRKKLI